VGTLDPPPGYQPAHYVRNLDIPVYLAWIELARTHWLLPNGNAPWITEPALFQPMFFILARRTANRGRVLLSTAAAELDARSAMGME
jgi:hypothetical protein